MFTYEYNEPEVSSDFNKAVNGSAAIGGASGIMKAQIHMCCIKVAPRDYQDR